MVEHGNTIFNTVPYSLLEGRSGRSTRKREKDNIGGGREGEGVHGRGGRNIKSVEGGSRKEEDGQGGG